MPKPFGVERLAVLGKKLLSVPPTDGTQLKNCVPVYIDFPGWKTPTEKAKKFSDLPKIARNYLKAFSDLSGAKLRIASVGPGRDQTIVV